ncbi:hypothetical protein ACFL0I_04045, partial [Gemmatimonadota bacterium]
MSALHRILRMAFLVALPLSVMSCQGPEGTSGTPEPDGAVSEGAIVGGEDVEVQLPDGSYTGGVAVTVRKSDGTTELAVFRGPTKLADVVSQ